MSLRGESDTRAIVITAALASNIRSLLSMVGGQLPEHSLHAVGTRLANELAGPPSFAAMSDADVDLLHAQVRDEILRRWE